MKWSLREHSVISVCVLYGSTMFKSHIIHTVFIVWEWSQCEMVTAWTQCDLCVCSVWINYVQITHHSHSFHSLGVVTMWNGHCVSTVWFPCVFCEVKFSTISQCVHIVTIHTVELQSLFSLCVLLVEWFHSVFPVWQFIVCIFHCVFAVWFRCAHDHTDNTLWRLGEFFLRE